MDGWIKLHRALYNKPIFQNPELLQAWLYCLFKASHKKCIQQIGMITVELEPGQFVTGRKSMADDLGISQSKAYRLLKWLEKNNSITLKSNNKFTVVTVVNWEVYQSADNKNEQQMNNKRTTNEQPVNTNKNGKNGKNGKNNIKNICVFPKTPAEKSSSTDEGAQGKVPGKGSRETEYTPEFEEFWSIYPRKVEKKRAFRCWKTRLKEGILPEILILAAKNYAMYCKKESLNQRFIKHGSTFLGPDKPFEDFAKEGEYGTNSANFRSNEELGETLGIEL